MDSVFVITKTPPSDISNKEMVLTKPDFLDEVKACVKRKGSSAAVGPNYLRAIAEEIGRRYDRSFNAYRNVVPTDFMGRVCTSDEAVAAIVHEMFAATYPVIYQKFYETKLRERSFHVRVIYFAGDEQDAVVFPKLGISQISEDELAAHLGVTPTPLKVKTAEAAPKAEAPKTEAEETAAPAAEVLADLVAAEEAKPKLTPQTPKTTKQQLTNKQPKLETTAPKPVQKQA